VLFFIGPRIGFSRVTIPPKMNHRQHFSGFIIETGTQFEKLDKYTDASGKMLILGGVEKFC